MCLFKIRLFKNLVLIVVVRILYDTFEENDFPVKVYSSGGKRCFMQMETKRKLGSCTSIRQNRLENKRDGRQGRASQDVTEDGRLYARAPVGHS